MDIVSMKCACVRLCDYICVCVFFILIYITFEKHITLRLLSFGGVDRHVVE